MSAPLRMVSAGRRNHNSAAHSSAHRPPGELHLPGQRETRRGPQPAVHQVEQRAEQLREQLPEQRLVGLREQLVVHRREQLHTELATQVAKQPKIDVPTQVITQVRTRLPVLPEEQREVLRETRPRSARGLGHPHPRLQHLGADSAIGGIGKWGQSSKGHVHGATRGTRRGCVPGANVGLGAVQSPFSRLGLASGRGSAAGSRPRQSSYCDSSPGSRNRTIRRRKTER